MSAWQRLSVIRVFTVLIKKRWELATNIVSSEGFDQTAHQLFLLWGSGSTSAIKKNESIDCLDKIRECLSMGHTTETSIFMHLFRKEAKGILQSSPLVRLTVMLFPPIPRGSARA